MLEHQNIPDGSMVMGRPAKVTRALTEEEIAGLKESALSYIEEERNSGKKVIVCKKEVHKWIKY